MDEADSKVWNASAVILDIDSGTQNESHTFSCWNDIKLLQPVCQLWFQLVTPVSEN